MTTQITNNLTLNFNAAETIAETLPRSLQQTTMGGSAAVSVDIGDLPPLPSRSMRRIARRSKNSSRGGVVVQLPGWARPRIVFFESRLELNVLYILLARGDVIDVWEQPPSISYRDADGKRRSHFFDFLIVLKSGRRIAIAVKPAKIAVRSKFVSDLKCIRQEMRKDFADDILLITDQDFTKAEAQNAERYIDFARHKDLGREQSLKEVIASTSFPATVAELAAKLDADGEGFRSVFLAIYEGLLTANKTALIDSQTTVLAGGVQ
ncbi:MAG: TnsA endonuclease N-terminal domain-containing protein [Roseobacter sp.]